MNKQRQRSIKEYCKNTFTRTPALQRFGTMDCYERFCRKFFGKHHRLPIEHEFGKRHGKQERRRQAKIRRWKQGGRS